MGKVTTIEFDEKSQQALEQLQKSLGVTSNAAVIRKALMLTSYLSDQADAQGMVTIEDKQQHKVKLSLG